MIHYLLMFGVLSGPEVGGLLIIAGGLAIIGFWALPRLFQFGTEHLHSSEIRLFYEKLFAPHFSLLRIAFGLTIADFLLLLIRQIASISILEFPVALVIAGITCYVGIRVTNRLYSQNIEKSVDTGRKLDIEFFLVSKTLIVFALIFAVVAVFSATHHINLFGLLASLGIGGVAVAFAAQKVLEQFIGGIVLYFDSPFAIDDYIKLPDGTFGRVESIGLRLTKIRTSGKGTLVSVPNNLLVEEHVENFTSAGKIMAIVHLKFPQGVDFEEQALIRQVLIAGFRDLSGIDPNSTSVSFSDQDGLGVMQCQVSFCAFSTSSDLSMDLRREIIRVASAKVQQKLQEFNIIYEIEPSSNSINLPISI